MYSLGINYYGHDASCALFKNGKLIFAIEEERLSRKKHDGSLPLKSIDLITKKFRLNNSNVESVNFATIPERLVNKKHIGLYLKYKNEIDFFHTKKNQKKIKYLLNIRSELKKKIKFSCQFNFFHHHVCHQYSAYYLSGLKDSACFSFDGLGEIESTCFGYGKLNKVKIYDSINFPHSLGETYTAVTKFLGFKPESGEGTVMALAALGNKNKKITGLHITYDELFQKIIIIKNNKFEIDLGWFVFWKKRSPTRVSKKFIKIFGQPRKRYQKLNENHKNIAAALQSRFEEAYMACIKGLLKKTKQRNLVLSGGCALNCKANGLLEKKFNLKNIYIQPAAGDGGLSVGAGYLGFLKNKKEKNYNTRLVNHSYFGPDFSANEVNKTLKKNKNKVIFKYIKNIEEETAKILSQKFIVGWFQGRMEFGPRALGNRSILASPVDLKIKDRLNVKIKKREIFRPFAPAVLDKYSKKIFNLKHSSPFMLIATTLKDKKFSKLSPAILHHDNSARIQTVNKKNNKKFYNLIKYFYKITKVPMLLNTSFNGKGEPIVCSPQDAINCFLKNNMDYLIMGNFLVKKK